MEPDQESLRQKARRSISDWARRLQVGANPNLVMGGLVAAALMPTVGPLLVSLAGGQVAAGVVGTTALGLVKTLLGKTGESYIGEFVKNFVEGCGPCRQEEANARLQEAVARRLVGDGDAAVFRAEARTLIDQVEGLQVALDAAPEEVKVHLLAVFTQLSEQFEEFRTTADEILQGVHETNAIVRRHSKLIEDIYDRIIGLMPLAGPKPVSPTTEVPAEGPCPYRGLQPFQLEDNALFFGREALTRRLASHLGTRRFLVLVGASGSGKSSLVRAGLLPKIAPARLAGAKDSKWMLMTPGGDPLVELARALAPDAELPDVVKLAKQLEAEPRSVTLALHSFLKDLGDAGVVLIVDQFEETFTLCRDEFGRRRFIDALVSAVHTAGPVKVLLVVRDDFYGRFAAYPQLVEAMGQSQFLVGAMSEEELRDAIENPAKAVGLSLERGLVELVIKEVLDEPGALPLLSLALAETWERRQGRMLTLSGYVASGGVRGAIAQKADLTFNGLHAHEQLIARQVLLRLTQVGEGREATRRRVKRDELSLDPATGPNVDAVIDTLVDARLLTTSRDSVEISHEALIREWPTLRRWVEENRESLRIHRQLTEAAHGWAALERDPGALLRGRRLLAASDWAEEHGDELNRLEREFLDASRQMEASELQAARQRARRLLTLSVALAAVLVLAAVSAGLALREARRADAQRQVAVSRQLAAQADASPAGRPDLALSRSLEGLDAATTFEARSSLLRALQREPRLTAFLPGSLAVWSLAFSPDGGLLASVDGREVVLWDVQRRLSVGRLVGGVPMRLAFRPDGETLVTGGPDGVLLWDVGRREGRGSLAAGEVQALAFSPDGQTLVTGGPDGVLLWDVGRREGRGSLAAGEVQALAFSPDGRMIASGGFDGIVLWTAERGERLGELPVEGVNSLAFSPDGRTLASGTGDRAVVLWDVERRQPWAEPLMGHDGQVTGVAFGRDTSTLASASLDRSVVLWDPRGRDRLSTSVSDPARTGHIGRIAFLSGGRTIASVGERATVWDLQRPGMSRDLAISLGRAQSLALSRDGRRVAAYDGDESVTVSSLEDGAAAGPPLAGLGRVWSLAFSADGRRLAVGTADGTVTIWDVDTRRRLGEPLQAGRLQVGALAFTPDGTLLASSTEDEIVVWDLRRNTEKRRLPEGGGTLAFSSDGRRLAAGLGRAVATWDVEDGSRVDLGTHERDVARVAFSPDGRLLASGGLDGSLILWDVDESQPIGNRLHVHEDAIVDLTFGPDSRVLVSADRGGGIVRTDVDPISWRRTACAMFVDLEGVDRRVALHPPYPPLCRLQPRG